MPYFKILREATGTVSPYACVEYAIGRITAPCGIYFHPDGHPPCARPVCAIYDPCRRYGLPSPIAAPEPGTGARPGIEKRGGRATMAFPRQNPAFRFRRKGFARFPSRGPSSCDDPATWTSSCSRGPRMRGAPRGTCRRRGRGFRKARL